MTFDNLTSISPIDGRYSAKTGPLKAIFSEYGLIKYQTLDRGSLARGNVKEFSNLRSS